MHRRALLAAAALTWPALAQPAWPDRLVRLVVPFTPGGSTDIPARAVARGLSEKFGQQFVIDSRSGAGGTVGSEMVARAAPDGTTLMMGRIGTLAMNPAIYRNLAFDTFTSFQPIVLVATVANILIVHPQRGLGNLPMAPAATAVRRTSPWPRWQRQRASRSATSPIAARRR